MINFIGNRKYFFIFSIVIIIATFAFAIFHGVQLDIQFKGGYIVTYSYEGELDKDAFGDAIQGIIDRKVSVQEATDIVSGHNNMTASIAGGQGLDADAQIALTEKLQEMFPNNHIETEAVNSVDPIVGREFLLKSLVAVLFAALLMVIYVGFRFRKMHGLSAGVMAVVALFHDIIMIFAVFAFAGIPLNDNFIAVVLTILGYSLNDTIVIYDRIRENSHLYGNQMSLGDLVNKSINQSLGRTLMTTITTVLAISVVAVVSVLNHVTSIVSFAFPMIVGMVSGVYSSICVAGPLWVLWEERKLAKAKANKGGKKHK